MGVNGSTVLVLVQDTDTGEWVPVAQQTGVTIEKSRELIDDAAKGDDHAKHLYGRMETSVELEAAYVPNDRALQLLDAALDNGEEVVLRRSDEGTPVKEAVAKIESISEEHPDNDRSTVSISFQLQEKWRAVST